MRTPHAEVRATVSFQQALGAVCDCVAAWEGSHFAEADAEVLEGLARAILLKIAADRERREGSR